MEYKKPIVVAEIGCNHMGDLDIAFDLIQIAKESGADYAKFQKRNNKELLSESQYNAPHPNPINSYGDTYGEHRDKLEFDITTHKKLKDCCEKNKIGYATSVWDMTSASEVSTLNPDYIKIPSALNNNLKLLEYLIDHCKGIIHISFGMTYNEEIQKIKSIL